MGRIAHDHLKVSTLTIPLYDMEVRRLKRNEYISFVQPLLASPTSSVFNLKRIKTIFNIKAYVEHKYIDFDGFAGITLDAWMLLDGTVEFKWRDATMNGYIRDVTVVDSPGDYDGLYTYVEIIFEVGTSI